ncbi:MAG: hypothetical protein AAFV90_25225 [Cyanobacteria bacterium J06634_5]
MTEKLHRQKPRPVNRILGAKPRLGPIPADQIIPWASILAVSYLLGQILGLSWSKIGFFAAWGMSTWWILTGSKSWKFLSKFMPAPNWNRGYARYVSLLSYENKNPKKTSKKSRKKFNNFKPF